MQSTARKHELPLDKMCLQCDVTKKHKEEFRWFIKIRYLYRDLFIIFAPVNYKLFIDNRLHFSGAARDGAYIHGLFMEGARWDVMQGVIMESKLKELFPQMPVINVRVSKNVKKKMKWSFYLSPLKCLYKKKGSKFFKFEFWSYSFIIGSQLIVKIKPA